MSLPGPVALDATPVISGSTGVARYVTQLGPALEREHVELRRFAIGRRSFPAPPATRHVPIPARVVDASWRHSPWPRLEWLVGTFAVAHATGVMTPRTRFPLVATVYDVVPLRHPELFDRRHVDSQRWQVEALRHAAVVLAISAATLDDLLHLGVERNRLILTPLGTTPLGAPAPPAQRPAPGYLLTVGELARHKRYEVLLRALAALPDGPSLVMVGPAAGDAEHLRRLVGELGLSDRVRLMGSVSDAVLAGLYEDAQALCFPSLAEGFGLPVLEALSVGTPVLASDIPTTRELAGDAALYTGTDADAWAQGIEALAGDAPLRERLGRAGRARAAEFTWAGTARATIEGYRQAVATSA